MTRARRTTRPGKPSRASRRLPQCMALVARRTHVHAKRRNEKKQIRSPGKINCVAEPCSTKIWASQPMRSCARTQIPQTSTASHNHQSAWTDCPQAESERTALPEQLRQRRKSVTRAGDEESYKSSSKQFIHNDLWSRAARPHTLQPTQRERAKRESAR